MKTTKDLKKGMRVMLSRSASMGELPRWQGTVMDNCSKATRCFLNVEGWATEMGDVYSHDVEAVLIDGKWEQIEHTPKQLELKEKVKAMGY
jgi:hypothetical protein